MPNSDRASHRILLAALFLSILLAASLMVRHGDGSIVWDAAANAMAAAPRWTVIILFLLTSLLIASVWIPNAMIRCMSLLMPIALLWAAWSNARQTVDFNGQESYRLHINPKPTLLALAETSPSEYERTHLALYFYMHEACQGRTIIVFAANVFEKHYLIHWANVGAIRVEDYPHALTTQEQSELDQRPHLVHADGRGRNFVFFTDSNARAARQFRVMQAGDRFYVVPDSVP